MNLILYYREECHLCDVMRKALVVFDRKIKPLKWREIDIDRDPVLVRRYDSKVPVLCLGEVEACHYFLDGEALESALG